MKHPNSSSIRYRQHGVYAVEWAIVFPVFFVLIYATVSYGLTFLVKESMQNAVEDGARAALRYQADRAQRLGTVKEVVIERLSWLPLNLRPVVERVQVSVCALANEDECDAEQPCGASMDNRCVIHVQLELPYRDVALAPALPWLGVLLPERLHASASILVDQGGL